MYPTTISGLVRVSGGGWAALSVCWAMMMPSRVSSAEAMAGPRMHSAARKAVMARGIRGVGNSLSFLATEAEPSPRCYFAMISRVDGRRRPLEG